MVVVIFKDKLDIVISFSFMCFNIVVVFIFRLLFMLIVKVCWCGFVMVFSVCCVENVELIFVDFLFNIFFGRLLVGL